MSSSFRHANAVILNGLFVFLFRQETVEQLLSNIFDKEKNESAIVSVIQILLTLFETRRPASVHFIIIVFSAALGAHAYLNNILFSFRFEGHLEICPPGMNHPSFSVNQSILDAVRPRLKDFHQLLLEPPKVKTLCWLNFGILYQLTSHRL